MALITAEVWNAKSEDPFLSVLVLGVYIRFSFMQPLVASQDDGIKPTNYNVRVSGLTHRYTRAPGSQYTVA